MRIAGPARGGSILSLRPACGLGIAPHWTDPDPVSAMAIHRARSAFAPGATGAGYRRRFPAFPVDRQGLEALPRLAEAHGLRGTWRQGEARLAGPQALDGASSLSLEALTLELTWADTGAPAARLAFRGGCGILEGRQDPRVAAFAARVEAFAARRLPAYARCMQPLVWGYATLAYVLVTERPDLSRVGTEAAFLAWSGTLLFGMLMLLVSTAYRRRCRELRREPGSGRPSVWDRHGEGVLLFAAGLVMGLSAVLIGQRLA